MRRSTKHSTTDSPTGDQEDEHVNLQQKIAVSKEMTGLLERRLKEMHETGLVRQRGLKLDQNCGAKKCYSDVENARLQLAQEMLANEMRPSRLRSLVTTDAKGHNSTVASAREPTAIAASGGDGERRMSALTGFQSEGEKALVLKQQELKREQQRKEASFKRELQKIEVACAGRLIDSVNYTPDSPAPPFPMDVTVVLKYVGHKISVPYDPKYFRYYLLHPLSKSITNDLFWFIHCHTFQSSSSFIQEVLVSSVAEKYVLLSNKVEKNRSLFFQSYPYAVASAVCLAFHYFVPGSRNLYDNNFKLQVNVLVVRLLSGMEVCAVAVQNSVERLFPEERIAAEEAAKKTWPTKNKQDGIKAPSKRNLNASTMSTLSGLEDEAGSGEAAEAEEGEESEVIEEEDDDTDELTTKALAGKLNDRDRSLLGPVNSHHVEILRSLPKELLVPNRVMTTSASAPNPIRVPFEATLDPAGHTGYPRAYSPSHSTSESSSLPYSAEDAASEAQAALQSSLREPGVLRPTWSKKESESDAGFRSLLLRSKKRQLRAPFCASSVSPLVQRFLDTDASCIGRPIMLKRTTPVPWSAVGGVDTFRSTVPRDAQHAVIRTELQKARQMYTEELQQSRKEDSRVSEELREHRNAVLHGSQAARSQFCANITDMLEGRRRRGHADDLPIKRSHSNLLPAPSTLTSIRADMSVVDNFKLTRAENPAWENFKASGLGWNTTTAAVEFQLLPPLPAIATAVTTQLDSPTSEDPLL